MIREIPFFPHASITSGTAAAGMNTIARSTASGRSPTLLNTGSPQIVEAEGLTGYSRSGNLTFRLLTSANPPLRGSSEAPMTATLLGFMNRSIALLFHGDPEVLPRGQAKQ